MKKLLADLLERYYRFLGPEGLAVADRMIEVYKVLSEDSSNGKK